MEKSSWRIVASLFLIVMGGLILANNFGLFQWNITSMDWFWMLVFGGGGLAFLWVFLSNREHWWAAIPGFTLIGLSGLLTGLLPDAVGGAFFLGMIGLSFLVIYLTHRENWWAIIPAGTLLTLVIVILVSDRGSGVAGGAALFFGLALTFLLLYLLPTPDGRMRWAIWPAVGLGTLGLLLTMGMEGAAQYVLPAVLILAGGWLVVRAFRR